MAFLCAKFSNATNSNYDSEALFNRISTNFSVRITKEDSYD